MNNKPDFQTALIDWLARAQKMQPENYTLSIDPKGIKYVRILQKHTTSVGGSAFCFIDKSNVYLRDCLPEHKNHNGGHTTLVLIKTSNRTRVAALLNYSLNALRNHGCRKTRFAEHRAVAQKVDAIYYYAGLTPMGYIDQWFEVLGAGLGCKPVFGSPEVVTPMIWQSAAVSGCCHVCLAKTRVLIITGKALEMRLCAECVERVAMQQGTDPGAPGNGGA